MNSSELCSVPEKTSPEDYPNSADESNSDNSETKLMTKPEPTHHSSPSQSTGGDLSTSTDTTATSTPPVNDTMSKYKKYVSLVVLVVQNTALVLTMRYSRTVEGPLYLASTAVVMTELLKFVICVSILLYDNQFDLIATLELLYSEIIGKYKETINLSVPSVLYTVQNNLLYIALSYLNAATFQVSQLIVVY